MILCQNPIFLLNSIRDFKSLYMNVCSQVWFRMYFFQSPQKKHIKAQKSYFVKILLPLNGCLHPLSTGSMLVNSVWSAQHHIVSMKTHDGHNGVDHILLSTFIELLHFDGSVVGGTYWNSCEVLQVSLLSIVLVQFGSIRCMISRKPDPKESHRAVGKWSSGFKYILWILMEFSKQNGIK